MVGLVMPRWLGVPVFVALILTAIYGKQTSFPLMFDLVFGSIYTLFNTIIVGMDVWAVCKATTDTYVFVEGESVVVPKVVVWGACLMIVWNIISAFLEREPLCIVWVVVYYWIALSVLCPNCMRCGMLLPGASKWRDVGPDLVQSIVQEEKVEEEETVSDDHNSFTAVPEYSDIRSLDTVHTTL